MNEAETRAEHIDPALKAAGWGVIEGSRREYPLTLGRIHHESILLLPKPQILQMPVPQLPICRLDELKNSLLQ